jgi:transcriptional regulator with XRE-family HTH domain
MPRPKSRPKSHPEIEKTISELKAWCAEERGRQIEIARFFGVSRQSVNDWLNRDANPMANTLFEIRDFLKAQRGKGAK